MPACSLTAGPDELAALGEAFREAWRFVGPIDGPFEHPQREWLAHLILGLRRAGHSGDVTLLAIEQFQATSPMAEWATRAHETQRRSA